MFKCVKLQKILMDGFFGPPDTRDYYLWLFQCFEVIATEYLFTIDYKTGHNQASGFPIDRRDAMDLVTPLKITQTDRPKPPPPFVLSGPQ